MRAAQRLLTARPTLKWLPLVATLLLAAWASSARADTIRLSYDDTGADPAETFDQDCLGDTPADDCDTRAALIEGELATLLSQLESDEDPETLALFQSALELESPVVQAMAVRYLSRAEQQPDDFLAKVRTFFLITDAIAFACLFSPLSSSSCLMRSAMNSSSVFPSSSITTLT